MKAIGILVPFLFFLFISTTAFGQGRGIGHLRMDGRTKIRMHQNSVATERINTNRGVRREEARINGALQANEHANDRAKEMANENSVLAPASSGIPPYSQQKRGKERKEKKND